MAISSIATIWLFSHLSNYVALILYHCSWWSRPSIVLVGSIFVPQHLHIKTDHVTIVLDWLSNVVLMPNLVVNLCCCRCVYSLLAQKIWNACQTIGCRDSCLLSSLLLLLSKDVLLVLLLGSCNILTVATLLWLIITVYYSLIVHIRCYRIHFYLLILSKSFTIYQ